MWDRQLQAHPRCHRAPPQRFGRHLQALVDYHSSRTCGGALQLLFENVLYISRRTEK